jgi:hypothetical protein
VLNTNKIDSSKLIITGDLLVKTGALLKAQTHTLGAGNNVQMLIVLSGNYTCQGIMDARNGSAGSTMGVINFEFVGSTNTTITFTTDPTTTPANSEFNAIKVNKSGNGKIILGSNIISAPGSSSAPYYSSFLTLVKGKIYTGNYTLITTTTTGANLSLGTDSSYIIGAMGRGTSSGGGSREYYVGDESGYRPITVRTTTGNGATGNYVIVRLVSGNGNTFCNTFGTGIDKVSSGRYYQISWNKGTTSTAAATFDLFTPTHRNDALLDSTKASWKNLGPTTTPYTVMMDSLPRKITPDALLAPNLITLNSGSPCYVALARAAGTTDNTLDPATSVERLNEMPASFALSQNFPNPFNPSTTIRFSLERSGFTTLSIYDLLGRLVGTIAEGNMQAGTYSIDWNAAGLTSGLYFYTLRSGENLQTRKMLLMK